MLEQLYKEYGEAMVRAEILNNRIQELKRAINAQLSKPKEVPVKKEETKKEIKK